jgi:regulatory protein
VPRAQVTAADGLPPVDGMPPMDGLPSADGAPPADRVPPADALPRADGQRDLHERALDADGLPPADGQRGVHERAVDADALPPADGQHDLHERALDPEARLQRALDLGYRHLGKRDRTEAELRRHLRAKGADEPAIDGAVEALVRQGYIDDARYARTFAQDRRALDAWGPDRIEARLLALGIEAELVQAALAVRDADGELEAAVALLRRRWPTAPATERERERALGMLARKGYDLDLAYDAVWAVIRTDGGSEAA